MNAPLTVEVKDSCCRLRFNLVNRPLTSNLDDYIRIIKDKCELQFNALEIFWDKKQSPDDQIGQVLSAVKLKRNLKSLQLTVSDGNRLKEHFVSNMRLILHNNSATLETLRLCVGNDCFLVDIVNPLMEAVTACSNLRELSIQIGEKNRLEQYPQSWKLEGVRLHVFKWKAKLLTDECIPWLGRCLQNSRECFSQMKSWKLSLKVKEKPHQKESIELDYLGLCEQLQQLILKANVQCFRLTEQSFAGSIRRLKIKQPTLVNPAEWFPKLTTLTEFKLELLECTAQACQDLKGSLCPLIGSNPLLELFGLTLKLESISPSTMTDLFELPAKSLDLGFKITGDYSYQQLFSLCVSAVRCRISAKANLLLQANQITLKAQMTPTAYKMAAEENQYTPHRHDSTFREVEQLVELATALHQKGILNSVISFDPCLSSNYSRYKLDLYRKLLNYNWRYCQVKIANQFEIGCNRLLLNVDDNTCQTLELVLRQVHSGQTNRIIIYHHSDVPVSAVYKQLVELFQTKVFLCFCNYFMYTQTRTPEYIKMVKPCEKQAEFYERRVLQFAAVLRRWGERLRHWELDTLLENVIPEIESWQLRRPTPLVQTSQALNQQAEQDKIQPVVPITSDGKQLPPDSALYLQEETEQPDIGMDVQYEDVDIEHSPVKQAETDILSDTSPPPDQQKTQQHTS